VFKYLSLLRSSDLPPWHQKERATISGTRFRFQEKRRPDDYVSMIAQTMAWPVPPELMIAGPQRVWEWDDNSEGEKQVREVLDTLRITQGRAVLMGPGDAHDKLAKGEWLKEPWYGTEYRVVRFDEEFVKEVREMFVFYFCGETDLGAQAEGPNDIKELFLPGPNKFIPTNLEVAKQEAKEVRWSHFLIAVVFNIHVWPTA
jgi:insulysin